MNHKIIMIYSYEYYYNQAEVHAIFVLTEANR